jgi:chemotaxis methyl-accepting protein methylase
VNLELTALLEVIETNTGLRLNPQQSQALNLLLEKSAAAQQMTPDALVKALQLGQQMELLAELQSKFTVSETHFYRVAPQIEALRMVVLPELIARGNQQRQLRFWSAGCSSGEEVYTLLMLIEEIGGVEGWDVRVLGTDINLPVLDLARTGIYGHWSFRDTPLAAIERFFRASGGKYRVRKDLRSRAVFEIHNLLEPYPTEQSFDLILCRNVTIYFSAQTAQSVYEKLAAQLLPGGWLILGPSDPPMQPVTLERTGLEMILLPGVIAWKKPELVIGTIKTRAAQRSWQRKQSPEHQPKLTKPNTSDSIDQLWKTYLHNGDKRLMLKDYNAALEQYRRAVFLEPNEILPHIGLAKACLGVNQIPRAFSALRHAKRLLLLQEPSSCLWGCDLSCAELLQLVDLMLEPLEIQLVKS